MGPISLAMTVLTPHAIAADDSKQERYAPVLTPHGLTLGASADVDDSNTAVIAIKDDGSNSIVSVTYDTGNAPPSADYESLGSLDATHKKLAAGEHMTVAVTQGTTADLPGFFLVVRSRKTNA